MVRKQLQTDERCRLHNQISR